MVYNGGDALVVIMNNDTTGMTAPGARGNGRTAQGTEAPKLDIGKLARPSARSACARSTPII